MITQNLSQPSTSFIGKDQDIVRILGMLNDPTCRLLTLTGPGGSGKTRLAIEIARQATFADGLYFVPLQPVQDVDQIPSAIIDVLQFWFSGDTDPLQQIINYMRERRMLVILDNFEQLMDGTGIISQILNETTHPKLLVTTRERLNIQSERIWQVSGLDVPGTASIEALREASASQLFASRAQQVNPDFSLETEPEGVMRICQLVDGLPLAIELAASWTQTLSCRAIAEEIQTSIDFLTTNKRDVPERHRAMRAVFDSSWTRMKPKEQQIFQKLSIFRGGFTAEAAKQVAGTSLMTLRSLIDRSLVYANDEERFDMQELVRQYAYERLEAAGEVEQTLEALCQYVVNFVIELKPVLGGPGQTTARGTMKAEFENIRLAWHYAIDHRNYPAIERMSELFNIYSYLLRWGPNPIPGLARDALNQLAAQQVEVPVRVALYLQALTFDTIHCDPESARALLRTIHWDMDDDIRALIGLRAGGALAWTGEYSDFVREALEFSLNYYLKHDRFLAARLLLPLSRRFFLAHDYDRAQDLLQQSLDIARGAQNAFGIYGALGFGQWQAIQLGHVQASLDMNAERHALAQQAGDIGMVNISDAERVLWELFCNGRFEEAQTVADRTIHYGATVGITYIQLWCWVSLSLIANLQGDYTYSRQLIDQVRVDPNVDVVFQPVTCSLVINAYGLGREDEMVDGVKRLCAGAVQHGTMIWKTWSLIPLFLYCVSRNLNQEAVRLLGLTMTHPAVQQGWLERWTLLDQLRVALEKDLGVEAYARLYEDGAQLELTTVIHEWAAKLNTELGQSPLADPLTDRELEILQLVASGWTNREIAAELVISPGTVRWHIHNVCSKLAASNRTHAVARARQLQILQ